MYILGGIFSCFYPLWGIGVYAIVAGVLIMAFEWSLPGVDKMGVVSDNFLVRAFAYLMCATLKLKGQR